MSLGAPPYRQPGWNPETLPPGQTEEAGFVRQGYADQLSIETPEQVALQFPVAGIGSRFVALLLDHLIQLAAVVAVVLVVAVIEAATGGRPGTSSSLASQWFVAGIIFVFFLLFWGYFFLFEAFWRGQTPGKRWMKLRVIKDAGRQITLFESMARNLLRVADYLPSLYLAGVITMLCNKRNKRLGDLAAGTLVIHERTEEQPLLLTGDGLRRAPVNGVNGDGRAACLFAPDAVARLSVGDLVILEAFFARALDLPLDTRAAMAHRIAAEMSAKMATTLPEGNPERALEAMAVELRRQGRRA